MSDYDEDDDEEEKPSQLFKGYVVKVNNDVWDEENVDV
jgi:hypothetical protein